MSSRNLGAAVLVLAAGLGVWFYYFGRAGRDAPVAPAAPPAVAVAPVAPEMPPVPATPPKPAEAPAPAPEDKTKAEAEAKAKAEAEARAKYYAAAREEMKTWGDKGKNGPVVHFLRNISGFSADDLATMERLTGVKFRDDMKIGEWVEALLDAGEFPGTLDDWRSPDCRLILNPDRRLVLRLTGKWAGAAELAASLLTEPDYSMAEGCSIIARNAGLK